VQCEKLRTPEGTSICNLNLYFNVTSESVLNILLPLCTFFRKKLRGLDWSIYYLFICYVLNLPGVKFPNVLI